MSSATSSTKADHKYRADRLLYKEQVPAALREAVLAGPDEVLLAKARAAVIANAPSDAAIAAVPKALQKDPGLIFSRIQKARRANRTDEAADLMLAAPRDPAQIIDGDEWWTERRLVARKLLDLGETRRAYRVAAEHSAASDIRRMEAEFHAGWIALRFLDDPKLAAGHFAAHRGAGRDADLEVAGGLLAGPRRRGGRQHARVGRLLCCGRAISDHASMAKWRPRGSGARRSRCDRPRRPRSATQRCEAVRVAEYLFGLGERDIALPLALDVARNEPSEAQVGAMAAVAEQAHDAWATLSIGKAATQRGMTLDETGVSRPSASPNSSRCAIRPISPPSTPSRGRKASSTRSRCRPPAPRA